MTPEALKDLTIAPNKTCRRVIRSRKLHHKPVLDAERRLVESVSPLRDCRRDIGDVDDQKATRSELDSVFMG